ncbi:MAG TPA: type II toxin-antitoxin system VapC family toxin [Acidimicrobiales bacterium]|nr:type II toxin-antitoxin system VapC family toxin [Acidimicrobiales bacterium]
MLVVDASAVLEALAARHKPLGLVERLSADDLAAPHLIDVEVLSALRRLVATGELSDDRANDARFDYAAMAIARFPHESLVDRAWALGEDMTAYDAMYVVLAEMLESPLITCDQKLEHSPNHRARVEVFPPTHQGS